MSDAFHDIAELRRQLNEHPDGDNRVDPPPAVQEMRNEIGRLMSNDENPAHAVEHPPHYSSEGGIECIDVIRSWGCSEAYLRAIALKYLWRYRSKGNPVQDLEKAIVCLRMLQEECVTAEDALDAVEADIALAELRACRLDAPPLGAHVRGEPCIPPWSPMTSPDVIRAYEEWKSTGVYHYPDSGDHSAQSVDEQITQFEEWAEEYTFGGYTEDVQKSDDPQCSTCVYMENPSESEPCASCQYIKGRGHVEYLNYENADEEEIEFDRFLSCPFCGCSDDEVLELVRESDVEAFVLRWFVRCGNCGARGPYVILAAGSGTDASDEAADDAVDLWDNALRAGGA